MAHQEMRNCQICRDDFIITPDDFGFYERMQVPAPNLCPACRFKRRAVIRNEMTLYTCMCDLCKKSIVSMYHPKSPYPVYCVRCWDSDKWDPYSYGVPYDPSRKFFDQFDELLKRTPKKSVYTTESVGPNSNSEYINVAGGAKNCYFIFNSGLCEDVLYSRGLNSCRDSMDLYFGVYLERCYETVNVNKSSGIFFGHNVIGSLDSMFLRDASNCQNCIGCVNVRNVSYQLLNKPISKEEYQKLRTSFGSYAAVEDFKKQFDEFSLQFPRREHNNIRNTDVSGDYVYESKHVHDSFEITQAEDCRYLFSSKFSKDCYDMIGHGYDGILLLEVVSTGFASQVIGSYGVENSQNIAYSFMLDGSHDCFGCDALQKAKHCILNHRYEEREYRKIRDVIIGELTKDNSYGLSMPPFVVPFGYNESIGNFEFPMTRAEALVEGFKWQDELQMTKGRETLTPEKIPDHIKDVSDSLLDEVLRCVGCARNYKIVAPEIQFYRKMNLPIPRQCFYCRHGDRLRRRGPMRVFDRICAKCSKVIKTSYAQDRPEIVYCESCYQNEVI
jgi:hypothetical protein